MGRIVKKILFLFGTESSNMCDSLINSEIFPSGFIHIHPIHISLPPPCLQLFFSLTSFILRVDTQSELKIEL